MSGWVLAAALALGDDGTGRCGLERDPGIRRSGDDLALARELDRTGFPASAGLFYARAACEAPGDEDTLVHALSRAKTWGAREDLESFARWLPAEKYPSRAPNLLAYVEGRRLRDAGKLDQARLFLGRTSEKSDLFPQAQLMLCELEARRGKRKTADACYKSVVTDARDPEAADRARLALFSLYYEINRFDEAVEHLREARPSAERDAGLRWAWFMTNGRLSHGADEVPWGQHPEVDLLRVLTPFMEVRLEDVEAEVGRYEATWSPVAIALEEAVADLARPGGEGRLFQRYRKGLSPVPHVPEAFLHRWLETREVTETRARHAQLLAERLRMAPGSGKRAEALADEVAAALARVERRGGELLARGVRRAHDEVVAAAADVSTAQMEAWLGIGDPRGLERLRTWTREGYNAEARTRQAVLEGGDMVAKLRRVSTDFPNADEPKHELALWLWEAGEREEAVRLFGQITAGQRRVARAFVGQYHFDRGAFVEALDAFREADDSYMVAWCEWALGDKAAALATMRASKDKRAAADAVKMERVITGG